MASLTVNDSDNKLHISIRGRQNTGGNNNIKIFSFSLFNFFGMDNRKLLSTEYIPDREREGKEEFCW